MKNWLRKTLAAALILGVAAGLGSPDDAEAAKRKKKVAPKPVSKVEQEVVRQAWRAGQQMVEEGRLKGAVAFFRRYLALKPRSVDGWYWLGRAFAAQGDYERAQNAFVRAVAIDPEYPALTPDRRDLWLRPMVVHSPWKAPLLAGAFFIERKSKMNEISHSEAAMIIPCGCSRCFLLFPLNRENWSLGQ